MLKAIFKKYFVNEEALKAQEERDSDNEIEYEKEGTSDKQMPPGKK